MAEFSLRTCVYRPSSVVDALSETYIYDHDSTFHSVIRKTPKFVVVVVVVVVVAAAAVDLCGPFIDTVDIIHAQSTLSTL